MVAYPVYFDIAPTDDMETPKIDNTYQLAASIEYADRLVEQATKEQLAEASRLLALAVGYYSARFGEVPQEVLLKMLRAETLDDANMAMVIAGMQNLASMLTQVINDGNGESVH